MSELNPLFERKRIRGIEDDQERERQDRAFRAERRQQRLGIATLGGLMIETIVDDPDTNLADLISIVKEHKNELRLAEYQQGIFKKMVREFSSRRNDRDKLLNKFPDGKELYQHLFFAKCHSVPRLLIGPITVHLILSSKDYDAAAGEHDPESGRSGGRYFPRRFAGVVSIGRAYGNSEVEESTARHEETHAIYDLMVTGFHGTEFEDTFHGSSIDYKPSANLPIFKEIARTKNEQTKGYKVTSFWEHYIAKNSNSLKNEIFAFSRQGSRKDNKVVEILSRPESQKGLYDYFAYSRRKMEDAFKAQLSAGDSKIALAATDAFFRTGYRTYVREAIAHLGAIMRTHGLTIEQAMVYLIDIPLVKWGKEI